MRLTSSVRGFPVPPGRVVDDAAAAVDVALEDDCAVRCRRPWMRSTHSGAPTRPLDEGTTPITSTLPESNGGAYLPPIVAFKFAPLVVQSVLKNAISFSLEANRTSLDRKLQQP